MFHWQECLTCIARSLVGLGLRKKNTWLCQGIKTARLGLGKQCGLVSNNYVASVTSITNIPMYEHWLLM